MPRRRAARLYRRKVARYAGMTASGRPIRAMRRFRAARTSKGFLKLVRKLPEIYATTTNSNPGLTIQDPTSTCLQLGAPILDPNGVTYSYPFVLTFQLNQIINHTDITNLCDAYKLKYVNVGCTYQCTQTSVTSSTIMPNITWITDHDDNTLPVSVNNLREKMGSKMRTFGMNKLLKIGVKPRVAAPVYNGVLSAYSIPKPQWLNSTYDAVPHYAIKGILNNVSVGLIGSVLPFTSFKFDVTTTILAKDFQ